LIGVRIRFDAVVRFVILTTTLPVLLKSSPSSNLNSNLNSNPNSNSNPRQRTNVLEGITATMRHVTNDNEEQHVPEVNLEDQGEVLRSGAIYGFEHIVLPSQQGFKNVLVRI
jgi:hypothetical protein